MRRIRRLSILAALVLAGSMWFYVEHLLVPYQVSSAAAHGEPRGNLSDLYPRWVGTRELLLHGRDPYSADVTREIQAGYWGRPLDSSRANDPKDESRFAYPVYVVFLLAPTSSLPFPALRIAASWILGTLTALSVPLWLRVLRWRPSYDTSAILLLLTLSSYSAVQGIKLQQLSLLVCALMAASLVLLVDGHLVAAGALLAVATIKPQLVVFLAAWLTLWAMNDWRERQRFFWSFLGTWLLLAGAGSICSPAGSAGSSTQLSPTSITRGHLHPRLHSPPRHWRGAGGGGAAGRDGGVLAFPPGAREFHGVSFSRGSGAYGNSRHYAQVGTLQSAAVPARRVSHRAVMEQLVAAE